MVQTGHAAACLAESCFVPDIVFHPDSGRVQMELARHFAVGALGTLLGLFLFFAIAAASLLA
jgi:hypothetical protein